MSITRVSIDLWGTLIKSSPFFSEEKYKLVQKYFPDVSPEYAAEVFAMVKKEFNSIIESTGYQPTEKILYTRLFYLLNGGYADFKTLKMFVEEYNELALIHHPVLYSEETRDGLKRLSELAELTVSSNTMFIRGTVLHRTIEKLDIAKYFAHFNFSDQLRCSKPDPVMYFCKNSYSNYHIGDNLITDGRGPELVGSRSIIINSNKNTILNAINFITQIG